jgi:hypothetical protein
MPVSIAGAAENYRPGDEDQQEDRRSLPRDFSAGRRSFPFSALQAASTKDEAALQEVHARNLPTARLFGSRIALRRRVIDGV